jgi:hypothetical protein
MHIYGENLIEAVLHGSGWTYHHDELILQVKKIAKHPGMTSDMDVED